ncbi:MAG: CRISPR-associated endonuclease Cas3'', partial [Saprospiraceae bacterium]|nr:CRISPR-associated endonuclease Cas3'' [Saprospiraceae bacterium]
MKTLVALLDEAIQVDEILENAGKYLAHIPKPGDSSDKKNETLGEHLNLVVANARRICELHGLNEVVERLVGQLVKQLNFDKKEAAADWVAMLFSNTIIFHDFGKVNEYFQVDRMKNDDAFFKGVAPEIFTPRYGHSELGGYIFSVYHLEKIEDLDMPDEDRSKLAALTLLFSNTILLHHSPKLKQPGERVLRSQFIKYQRQIEKYLRLYKGFPKPAISTFCFDNIKTIVKEFEDNKAGFALFALLRLNFSLLTAADYMATWHYGYEMEMQTERHWGVLGSPLRTALIHAARTAKEYNALAYKNFEDKNYRLRHPLSPNGDNLNLLRTEMTVEVLQQLERHHEQRLFYLEAPTGGGKTNLSLLAVVELLRSDPGLNKVFYVFPFTTLIT